MPRVGYTRVQQTLGAGDGWTVFQAVTVPNNGWITDVAVYLVRNESDPGKSAKICLWDPSGKLDVASAAFTVSANSGFTSRSVGKVRAEQNSKPYIGFWIGSSGEARFGYADEGPQSHINYESSPGTANPSQRDNYNSKGISAYLDYQPNAAPSTPAISAPVASAQINGIAVTVAATLPHPSADNDYDYTKNFQIQVYESGATAPTVSQTFATTATERNNAKFSREITGLQPGVSYYVRVRHQDSWDVWSDWTGNRNFSTITSADPPELTSPLVKLDVRSGFSYQMIHNHPQGFNAKAAQVRLYNANGATLLWTSAQVTLGSQASPGQSFSIPASGGTQPGGASGHPTLAWATGYRWQARVQDTANTWSPWADLEPFKTNSTPAAPTNLVPANNARTGDRIVSATVSDPDGDQITAAQIELVRVSTGAVVTGYPKAMSIAGNKATFEIPTSDLVTGAQYRFRVRATDGLDSGYGPYSGYNAFFYAIAPIVTLLSPVERRNLVWQPSAEYEPPEDVTERFWTVVNPDTTGTNHIVREESEDTYFGDLRWVGVRTDTTKTAPYMESKRMPVAQLERYLAQIMVKHLPLTDEVDPQDPIPATTSDFRIYCYASESASSSLGNVVPASIRSLAGVDPDNFWERYGGAIWPSDESSTPKFPSTTTHVVMRITPVSGASTGRVAFDAVMFEQMPDAADGTQYADSSFFGYGDPETDGYGGSAGEWTADEGNSAQEVAPVLVDAATNHVMYSYSHPSGTALNATRIVVQRWDERLKAWRAAYDSGYRAPASTPTVTVPDYLFVNENRYRVRVICRDSASVTGSSGWTELVSRYPGPPELPIYSYQDDPARGTISIDFASTDLDEGTFAGIQVARSSEDEARKIVAIIRDPGVYQYTYHYPLSGRDYTLWVRQLANIGPERVAGRWTRIEASVDYSKLNFLKNAHDPEEFVAFQHESGAGPQPARAAESTGYVPWGSKLPVHLFSEARTRSDTTIFALYPQDDRQEQSEAERLRTLRKWEEERPPLALIVQQPEPEKFFIALSGEMKFQRRGPLVYVEFGWEATAYEEPTPDEMEGIVDLLELSDLTAPGG